jgi:hypothetical protein
MIKSITSILCLSILLTLYFSTNADAQKRRTTEKEFGEKLWYGGGFALGFYGGNNSGFSSNEFFFGISPMVGYKVTEYLSFGPRLELSFLSGRYDLGHKIAKRNSLNYGAAMFGRAKFLNVLFGHVEYGYQNQAIPYLVNGDIETERVGNDQFLIGLGYNSGYPFGSEISILYDVLAPDDTVDLPIVFRFGFTYQF